MGRREKAKLKATGLMLLKVVNSILLTVAPLVTVDLTWKGLLTPFFVFAAGLQIANTLWAVYGESPMTAGDDLP